MILLPLRSSNIFWIRKIQHNIKTRNKSQSKWLKNCKELRPTKRKEITDLIKNLQKKVIIRIQKTTIDQIHMLRKIPFQTKDQIANHRHKIEQVQIKNQNSKATLTKDLKTSTMENLQTLRTVEHIPLRSHFLKERVVYDVYD